MPRARHATAAAVAAGFPDDPRRRGQRACGGNCCSVRGEHQSQPSLKRNRIRARPERSVRMITSLRPCRERQQNGARRTASATQRPDDRRGRLLSTSPASIAVCRADSGTICPRESATARGACSIGSPRPACLARFSSSAGWPNGNRLWCAPFARRPRNRLSQLRPSPHLRADARSSSASICGWRVWCWKTSSARKSRPTVRRVSRSSSARCGPWTF